MAGLYWILSSSTEFFRGYTADEILHAMLAHGTWLVPDNPGHRHRLRHMTAGDRVSFHLPNVGIVARATVAAEPGVLLNQRALPLGVKIGPSLLPLSLKDVHWIRNPMFLGDARVRARLDAFRGKHSRQWGWIVQLPYRLTEDDFRILTRS